MRVERREMDRLMCTRGGGVRRQEEREGGKERRKDLKIKERERQIEEEEERSVEVGWWLME